MPVASPKDVDSLQQQSLADARSKIPDDEYQRLIVKVQKECGGGKSTKSMDSI